MLFKHLTQESERKNKQHNKYQRQFQFHSNKRRTFLQNKSTARKHAAKKESNYFSPLAVRLCFWHYRNI